ncbi:MAG: AAA family ATPase [Anaerolineales bacterium]|nr:AAA family ATPase [Anaerolineales bacterium]
MTNPVLAEVLASYVPRLIQKRVALDPSPIESPVAEDIQAAVLFADISGFTRLTEQLAEAGPSGVEAIANILNEYFGQLINIVHHFGGDVVKFAGDAVIAVWNIASDTIPAGGNGTADSVSRADQWQWTMRAAECALEIRARLSNYKVENANLYLKLAISTGSITTAHVGGVFNRWEFLLTGNPLIEVGLANSLANSGDIIVTPSAWRLIRNDGEADPLEFELKESIAQGGRLKSLNKPSSIFETPAKPMIPEGAEGSLRPYIPGAIINRLTAGQSSWIAELRRATVLFINLPDIDQKTELADAQNVARLVQRSVYRYEGSINKINVDDKGITIVAAMGLPPFSHENDPARGLQAALMVRKELSSLKIRSNIGVATGRIFCGSIGNDSRREYTTIGNAVNLSARLMAVAGHQDELIDKYDVPILCDRATFDAAKDSVEFQVLPPQQVKGRSEPVEVFHPIDVKKSVIRPATEMIGRQEEKALIANALQELARGTPQQTLIVQGEAGIGKSRLFEDLIRQAETLHVHMLTSTSDPIEKSNPYHVWRPIFNKIFDIEELLGKVKSIDEARNIITGKVMKKLKEIDSDLVRYAPLLDAILPIQIPDNELTSAMTGEIRGSNIRELLTRVLSHEAANAPLLLVLEDLHWFDSTSWTLLVDVQLKVRPVLLALNTRPLPDPVPLQFKQLLDSPEARLIKLEVMMLDDVEALVCQRLGVKSIPPMIGRLIREKSEGHPFFAEELAYALREAGILVINDHECHINTRFSTFEDISLPDTLQAAIINRIDSLNPSQQLTLKVASVIGRIFTFRVLEAVHPIEADRPQLPDYMDSLTRLSLTMVESELPDLSYIFKHAVTQEVAYNLMLYSQRRRLHQAVAEWIEQTHSENLDPYYTLLAHHWVQAAEVNADSIQKAVIYLEKAGEQAMQNHANKEAIQFFTQALEWDAKLPKPDNKAATHKRQIQRSRWYSRIGLAHYGLGSLPECSKNIREALRLLDSPIPDSSIQFGLSLFPQITRQIFHHYFPSRYIGSVHGDEREVTLEVTRQYELMSRIYFYSNETLPIVYTGLRLLNSAQKAGPSPELASAYASMSVLAGIAQLHKLAETYAERGVSISKEFNQPSNLITVNVVTSAYNITVGKWKDVREKVEEAKALCEQLGDYRQWGDCVAMLGESALLAGDLQYSMEMQKALLADARRRRSPLHQCWSLLGVAVNNLRFGKEAEAIPMLEDALKILDETPNLASSIETNGQLALAYFYAGQEEQALPHANKVLELSEGLSPTVYSMNAGFAAIAEVYFELWEKALRTNGTADSAKYQSLAEKAIKRLLSFRSVFPIGEPDLHYYQGWFDWLTNKQAQALRSWQKGLDSALRYNMRFEEGLIRMKLGMALASDPASRKVHLDKAISIFEKMDAVPKWKMARELAGQL